MPCLVSAEGVTSEPWKRRWELAFDPIPGPTLLQTIKSNCETDTLVPSEFPSPIVHVNPLRNSFELYATRDLLGKIVETAADAPLSVDWWTYAQVWEKTVCFASGLWHLTNHSQSEFMTLYAKNRSEWVIADLATMILNWTSVPIPASLDVKDIEYILKHAEVTTIVTSRAQLPGLISVVQNLPKLHLIVVMDQLDDQEYISAVTELVKWRNVAEPSEERKSRGVAIPAPGASSGLENQKDYSVLQLVDFVEVENLGQQYRMTSAAPPEDETTKIATLVYTSGSTGRPKGAVNTYDRWNKFISYIYNMPSPLVRLSFMPLAHNTERQQSHLTVCYGGKMCFSRGEMSKIFEEFALVNPTTLSAAPRFYDSIYNQYQGTLAQFRKDYPDCLPSSAESYCLSQYTGILGNAMQVLVVGGAMVSSYTKDFLVKCFNIQVFDGYGTTEVGGITADGKLYPGTEVKIVDCPDLGYTSEDKPWPRGEVWVRTNTMVSGYYKDVDTTNEYFKDGWFVTGDIVEVHPGEEYHIIDRRKNLFKLTQGVFVAPSSIENKLLSCNFVHQIYVYGDHTRSNLVAVVVPNLVNLVRWLIQQGHLDLQEYLQQHNISESSITGQEEAIDQQEVAVKLLSHSNQDDTDLFAAFVCSLPMATAKVHRELINTAQQIQLPPYHTPAAVTLESVKWTAENRLVTPSDKPQRAALEKKYKNDLERMYREVALQQDETSAFSEQIKDVVADVAGHRDAAAHGESPIGDAAKDDLYQTLATDSLTTLRLIHTLNKKFNTNLSFMEVMRETGGRLTAESIGAVLSKRAKSSALPGLDSWTTQDPRILTDLDYVIPVYENLVNDLYDNLKPEDSPKKVLMTGATGFLGFHLVSQLLETYPEATLVLLIRADSVEAAKARFIETTAPKQRTTFSDAQLARLDFLPGDLALPRLGISEDIWNKCCVEIDTIYHVGAAVNWIWGYDVLRATNVLGTVELLKMATTTRLKYFYFISSVSTSNGVAIVPANPTSEWQVNWKNLGPLEETSVMSRDEASVRNPYAISKWVAENIVKRSLQMGLPGCVLRPGMITGHSVSGACHPSDFSPRLLIGLVQSQSAFLSNLPLEWMPVDYCARAIVTLAENYARHIFPLLAKERVYGIAASFNIQNPHLATYSTIVSYIQSYGIKMQTSDYLEWRQLVSASASSPLWPLLSFFGETQCSMYAQLIPAPQTVTILQEKGVSCPPANEALFHTYLKYLKEERLI